MARDLPLQAAGFGRIRLDPRQHRWETRVIRSAEIHPVVAAGIKPATISFGRGTPSRARLIALRLSVILLFVMSLLIPVLSPDPTARQVNGVNMLAVAQRWLAFPPALKGISGDDASLGCSYSTPWVTGSTLQSKLHGCAHKIDPA